ncbi:SusC/RagA family TonB-linked outer membrane protein [Phocaeicola plebeius]
MRYFNKAMLIASAALCLNLSVFSQNITLKTGNVTVKEAMEQLKKSSGYSFVFSSVDVNTQKRVSVSVQNASIEEAVKQILAGQQGLNYEVKGKKIIVQKKAQSSNVRKISGRVVDANNEPVIGASIQVEGTGIGTISDFDGNFTLEAAEGNTLVFSFIGYKKQYIEVKRQKSLSVVMREDSEMLDDVVVIGYGTVSKKELTSAVSHISSKDLLQIGSGNPAMQMQGKVSGLAVENSTPSDPNSSPSIQVRGVSSRSAGLGPLIVIDGVPGGSLDNVNENDIESIDVLKDGAASAIYGTRGSNGVIVITTKKGSTDGQIHTAYSGFVNITTPIRELNVLSADEFRKYNRGEDYGANTDWFDELTKVAVSHSHTLQVMGGNSKNNYKATVDYKNTEGIDLRSEREQLGARLSLNHTGKNDLYNVVLNVAPRVINYQDSDYDTFRSALMINPTTPVMDPNNPGYYTKITTYSTNNPVEILKLEQSGGEQTILSWDGTFKLNLLPLFSTNKNHYLSTQITLAQQIIETDYSWFRPSTSTIEQDNGFSGEASRKYDKNKQESLEWLVNYGYDTNNHHLKFMGGYSYQYFVNDGLNAENKNFASDILGPNNLGSGTYNSDEIGRLGMGSYKNDAKLIAFFGRLSYNYKDKLVG